jgi:hypothetical protein
MRSLAATTQEPDMPRPLSPLQRRALADFCALCAQRVDEYDIAQKELAGIADVGQQFVSQLLRGKGISVSVALTIGDAIAVRIAKPRERADFRAEMARLRAVFRRPAK